MEKSVFLYPQHSLQKFTFDFIYEIICETYVKLKHFIKFIKFTGRVVNLGLSDPYCRFKLGNEKHKSKVCKDTLNPQWKEHFDLKFFVDTDMILEVSIYDRDIRKDEFMGR